MASLGDLMVTVGARIDGFSSAMRDVVSQASDAADSVADKLESIGDVGQRLAVLGSALTAAITLPLEEIGRRSLDVAGSFEQTQIAFTTMLGSSSAAKDKLSELYKFAAQTPFELPQVLQGARQITAFGFSSKDIIPILTAVGDTVSGLGTGQAGMSQILSNLGKMKTAGKATADSLGDLGRDGVAAWQYLANALGKPLPVVQDMVTKRQVSAETAINAILAGMHEQFGGLMSSQMSSFGGMMSNLADQVTLTAKAIGDVLLPAGKTMLNWAQGALDVIKNLAQWFGQLPGPVQAFGVGLLAAAAGIGPILGLLGAFGMFIPPLMASLTVLAQFFGFIAAGAALTAGAAAAMAGWAVVIAAALAALTALGVWVYSNWAGIRASALQIFDGIGEAWRASVGIAANWLVTMMGGASSDVTAIWTKFASVFMSIWESISGVFHRAFDGFKNDLNDLIKIVEKIPGMQKVLSAGSAFDKGNADAAKSDRVEKAKKDLIGDGSDTPKLSPVADDWDQKHSNKLKTAAEELKTLKQALDEGAISADQFHKASDRLAKLQAQKNPYKVTAEATGKAGKIDHNALDSLSGAHAHEEAQVSLQRAQIEHDYQMAKPGSATRKDESAEDQAKADIAAAEKRKAALDATYEDERRKTLKNLDDKMALYKGDQAGHEKLIQAKTAAEDRFKAAIQKTTFDLETVKKQSIDRIQAAENKQHEDEVKAQQKSYEMAVKIVDLKVQALDKETQFQIKQSQFNASIRDKDLQFELESGNLSKAQYLRLKQEQYDAAYAMEVAALEQERDLIESEFADLLDKAKPGEQKQQIMADRRKRIATLDDRQQTVENRHTGQQKDTELGLKKIDLGKMNTVFGPVQSGFASAISNMIKGTQTFKQAWQSMATSILGSWINSLSQMAAKWVTNLLQMMAQWVVHKLGIVTVHTVANQTMVASDAVAAAESKQISMAQHMHEIVLAAKASAANAFKAVSGIPFVGPVLAPVAAAAAFAGVMMFSAEGGAVLPNQDSMVFAHAQEMILPKPISVGLQNLISSGGLSSGAAMMNQAQGGSLSSTALQMMRNNTPSDGETNNHSYNGPLHYHAAPGEAMTVDTFGKMFKTYVRQNNYKMA